jgi:hypothetical protein
MKQTTSSMRPLTLKRVIEICNLALRKKVFDERIVMRELGTSRNRARELILECERMKIVQKCVQGFAANSNTSVLIELFEQEDWAGFHRYFLLNYRIYNQFFQLLSAHVAEERGVAISQMVREAKALKLQLNQTAIEVLQNWCERLGILQRHLYTKRFYLLVDKETDYARFKEAFEGSYRDLNISRGLGLKLTYIEIPKLREEVCEKLKIRRRIFDVLLKGLCTESIGQIELSGAPTITVAKKSPLSIRIMKASKKDDILAPHLDLSKKRDGIEIGRKAYYYVALHEK